MIYFIFKDDTVYGCTEFEELIEDIAIANNLEDYEIGQTEFEDYTPNNNRYLLQDGKIVLNPNYELEQEQKEKARIQELSMTRSDFFDGTIMAWGIGQDELLVLIQGLLATLPIEDVKKLIAINNFKNALNFYRKHDLFKMLVNIPIKLTDTVQIILTEESLDKFFDEVDKGNKETAWQYLPQPTLIPIEPLVEEPKEEE
jgi:hypothetical protein